MNLKEELKISEEQKLIIKIILFLVAGILLASFLLMPAALGIKKNSNKIDKELALLNASKRQGNDIITVINRLKKASPDYEYIKTGIVSKSESIEFIAKLEDIAEANKINQKLDLNENKEGVMTVGEYKIMSLRVYAKGTMSDLMSYLQEIESLRYYININSLSITSVKDKLPRIEIEGEPNEFNLTIQAETYWEK